MKPKLIFLFLLILTIGWVLPAIVVVQGFSLAVVSTAHADDRSVTVKPKKADETATAAANGKYFALIIGNNSYKHLPKLKTAINDAKEVERVLRNRYGFETKLLLDAARKEILSTINDFRKRLESDDNLIIYYAGHGEFDKTADKAYWLPIDAQRDDPVNWIIADDITSNIKRLASKHILIISDSCYSGTLTRSSSTDLLAKGNKVKYIKKMMERTSRTLMASGGNEPVVDEGSSSGHSVFAEALLKALDETDAPVFTAEELFHSRVKVVVAGKSEQVPEYSDIRNSGHEGGDFIFRLAEEIIKEIENMQQLEANKTEWNARLNEMRLSFDRVIEYQKRKDITPELKIAAWKKLLDSYNEDNPYSQDDDAMRQNAQKEIAYLRSREIESKTTAVPLKEPKVKEPSTSTVEHPKSSFSLDDLEKKAQQIEVAKTEWKLKLEDMNNAFNKVIEYQRKDIPIDLKIAAWKHFADLFKDDNPNSQEDDAMRKKADEEIDKWKKEQSSIEQQQLSVKKKGDKDALIETEKFIFSELTVKDKKTCLIWARDANLADKMDLSDVSHFLRRLSEQKYGGCKQWGLPSKDEMLSLINYAKDSGITKDINEYFNKIGFKNVQSDWYWTATPISTHPVDKWFVSMNRGYMTYLTTVTNFLYVWPVCNEQR